MGAKRRRKTATAALAAPSARTILREIRVTPAPIGEALRGQEMADAELEAEDQSRRRATKAAAPRTRSATEEEARVARRVASSLGYAPIASSVPLRHCAEFCVLEVQSGVFGEGSACTDRLAIFYPEIKKKKGDEPRPSDPRSVRSFDFFAGGEERLFAAARVCRPDRPGPCGAASAPAVGRDRKAASAVRAARERSALAALRLARPEILLYRKLDPSDDGRVLCALSERRCSRSTLAGWFRAAGLCDPSQAEAADARRLLEAHAFCAQLAEAVVLLHEEAGVTLCGALDPNKIYLSPLHRDREGCSRDPSLAFLPGGVLGYVQNWSAFDVVLGGFEAARLIAVEPSRDRELDHGSLLRLACRILVRNGIPHLRTSRHGVPPPIETALRTLDLRYRDLTSNQATATARGLLGALRAMEAPFESSSAQRSAFSLLAERCLSLPQVGAEVGVEVGVERLQMKAKS